MCASGPSLRRVVRRVATRTRAALLLSIALGCVLPGCVLSPDGLDEEARRAEQAGQPWQPPFAERQLPELPAQPSLDDAVSHALLANGEVEAAWQAWEAAIQRVSVAAGWPNTNLSVELSAALSGGGSVWDRAVLGLGFDPMEMLALPPKLRQAGRVALEEARAAGRRFDAVRLSVRLEVSGAYLEYASWGERLALQEELVGLLGSGVASAGARLQTGAPQQGWLEAVVGRDRANTELLALRAEGESLRARLNARMGRPPDAPLAPPPLPASRPLASDEDLLAAGVRDNPELGSLAAEVQARDGSLRGEELRYWPDVAPSFEASRSEPEVAGLMFSVPVALPSLAARVNAARAELRAAEATARQSELDLAGRFASTLAALRAAERQVDLLAGALLPSSEQLVRNADLTYATGAAGFESPLAARRMAIETRELLVEARAARELRLAELEQLAGRELDLVAPAPPDAATGGQP
jgi:outer membrane protein TolC